MKRKIFIGLGILALGYLGFFVYGILTTRSHSPSEIKVFSHEGLDIKVVYGRPYKKGRSIFGEEKDNALVPYGKYWRLGANDATEIMFSKSVNFGGKPIEAGTYRMYVVPQANTWQISLNSELGKFGYFEPNYALDIIKIDVPVVAYPTETEQLTIDFEKDSSAINMRIYWDRTLVQVPIIGE